MAVAIHSFFFKDFPNPKMSFSFFFQMIFVSFSYNIISEISFTPSAFYMNSPSLLQTHLPRLFRVYYFPRRQQNFILFLSLSFFIQVLKSSVFIFNIFLPHRYRSLLSWIPSFPYPPTPPICNNVE